MFARLVGEEVEERLREGPGGSLPSSPLGSLCPPAFRELPWAAITDVGPLPLTQPMMGAKGEARGSRPRPGRFLPVSGRGWKKMAATHSPLASSGDGQGADSSRKSGSCRLGLGLTPFRTKFGSCPERPTLHPKSSAGAKARILSSPLRLRLNPATSGNPQMRDFN